MKLLFVDCETGGTDPERHSLLSVGVTFGEGVEREWHIEQPEYVVCSEALDVNGIDIRAGGVTLERMALELDRGWTGPDVHLAGWNVSFDERFLRVALAPWGWPWARKTLDVQSLALVRFGPLSLEETARRLGIDMEGRRLHSALEDARLTWEVYQELMR